MSDEIPRELGSLSNLEQLYLRNNQLSGEIPKELESLDASLYTLTLRSNQLTGCIPTVLQNELIDFDQLELPLCK